MAITTRFHDTYRYIGDQVPIEVRNQHCEVGSQVAQCPSILVEHHRFLLRPASEGVFYVKDKYSLLDIVLLSCFYNASVLR